MIAGLLRELSQFPSADQTIAVLEAASRFSSDEGTVIYYMAATRENEWAEIRTLIEQLGFFRWLSGAKEEYLRHILSGTGFASSALGWTKAV